MRQEPRKKGPMIWTIIIGLIMILSVIGFLYNPGSDGTERYNGYVITQAADGYYYVKIDNKQVRFANHPAYLAFSADQEAIELIKRSPLVFLTFNPTEEKDVLSGIVQARFDLTNDLSTYFSIIALQATTLNTTSYNLPIITCANATSTQPVVELKSGNDTSIYKKDNCVILEALSGQDLLKLKDRVLYGMFNVIR